jgi:HEPN domain-containing protein
MDDSYIARLDQQFIDADVPLHARPFCVVMELIRLKAGGDVLDNTIWERVMASFHRLYPSGDFSIPPILIGGVALRDRFYVARVNVGWGQPSIDPMKCIDISHTELETIWNLNPKQFWRAMYSVADLWDFGYGASDLRGQNIEADTLWQKASSSIEATAKLLANGHMLDAAVQSICLTAELGIKGALAALGVDESARRKLSHNIPDLLKNLMDMRPHESDMQAQSTSGHFPDYVKTRYSDHGMTRVQLNELAMRAQFIAADALRRLSVRNLAQQIQKDSKNPPRSFP